ncbi:MAG: TIGR02281 family clan AA aspartic protease [Gammaproteobacteria bacterium]
MTRTRIARTLCLASVIGAWAACPAAAERISIEALFKDRAVVNIDGRTRMLSAGQASPEGVRLIAADAHQAILEIDGRRRTFRLGERISASFAAPPQAEAVRIWPDAQGMYFTDGLINGYPVRFLVDTGATTVAMNRLQARRLGLAYKVDGTEGATSTASGVARAFYLKLARVRVGDIELRDVPAVVIDGDHPTEVLLGNSFLSKLDLHRDAAVLELRRK